MESEYLNSVIKQFAYYKSLGEKAMQQVPEAQWFYSHHEDSNSLAVLVKHLWGNMKSRWTDFLTSDGEKEWRNRDAEFENDLKSAEEVRAKWEEGWNCLVNALNALTHSDLEKIIYIRNQGHSVMEAINRQLPHYAYHIGQMVFLSKLLVNKPWESLSIPKGGSKDYNTKKFQQPKERKHFTDEYLKK